MDLLRYGRFDNCAVDTGLVGSLASSGPTPMPDFSSDSIIIALTTWDELGRSRNPRCSKDTRYLLSALCELTTIQTRKCQPIETGFDTQRLGDGQFQSSN